MVTIDEAAKCPKCGVVGKLKVSKRKFFEGEWWDVAVYECANQRCTWFDQPGWLVSSNERGEVYERDQGPRGQDKTFTPMSPGALSRGRMDVEEVAGKDVEADDGEVKEIKNPYR
jgi:hypothetical protein